MGACEPAEENVSGTTMREQELNYHTYNVHRDAVALLCGNLELLRQSGQVLSVICVKSLCRANTGVCAQMATLEKAEGLLEELRGVSYDAAVKDMEELKAFAAENVSFLHWLH